MGENLEDLVEIGKCKEKMKTNGCFMGHFKPI
jgi:hypothetical protein